MSIAPRSSFDPEAWKKTPGYIQGRDGERCVKALLQQMGYLVIPSYDYTGDKDDKAPKLQGILKSYVIPDMDTAHLRYGRQWVEVKTYSEPTFYRKKQEHQHGILKRHWEDYQEVERLTRTPVWICIYELNTHDVLLASQQELMPFAEWRDDRRGKGGQYYFPRNLMKRIANMQDYPNL